jgi:hypothetical protein
MTGQKFKGRDVNLMVNYAPVIRDGSVVGAVSVFQDISRVEGFPTSWASSRASTASWSPSSTPPTTASGSPTPWPRA